jgi:hypothetical protein
MGNDISDKEKRISRDLAEVEAGFCQRWNVGRWSVRLSYVTSLRYQNQSQSKVRLSHIAGLRYHKQTKRKKVEVLELNEEVTKRDRYYNLFLLNLLHY